MTEAINGTSANVPIENMSFDAVNTLTPEAILLYCMSRLNSLDEMIQSRMKEQQKNADDLKVLGELDGIMKHNGDGQKKVDDWVGYNQAKAEHMMSLYNQTSDPKVRALIEEKYALVTGGNKIPVENGKAVPYAKKTDIPINQDEKTGFKEYSATQWASMNANVKEAQDGMSKSNELTMIQLQSIISQRQLAIQLTTQMMQAQADGMKSIVQNIK